MEPVEIVHRRDHKFVPKDKTQKKPRCGVCGRGKGNIAHLGCPASLNVFASSRNEFVYLSAKKMWQDRFIALLAEAKAPDFERVLVEGEICFPDRQRRDQGNYRFIIEKALGDALTEGKWLADDDWQHYEFGNLAYRYEKGESWLRLTLLPMQVTFMEEPEPGPSRRAAPQNAALFDAA